MKVPVNTSNQGIQTANAGAVASVPGINAFYKDNSYDALAHLANSANKLVMGIHEDNLKEKEKLESLEDMEALQALEFDYQEKDLEIRTNFQGKNAEGVDLEMLGYTKSRLEPELAKRQGARARYFALKANELQNRAVHGSKIYKQSELNKYSDSILNAEEDKLNNTYNDPNVSAFEKERQTNDFVAKQRAINGEAFDLSGKEANLRAKQSKATQNQTVLKLQQNIDNGDYLTADKANANPNAVYNLAASKESGAMGSYAIGYDANGGTSYGLYQLSSKQGTMQAYLDYEEKNGRPEIKARFAKLGDLNTGSNKGAAVQMWGALVKEGLISDESQTKFIQSNLVEPALAKLSPEARKFVESSQLAQSAFISTAVQHGAGGASKLMNEAHAKNTSGNVNDTLASLYEGRKGNFKSSTPEVQASVANRLDEEFKSLTEHGNAVLSEDFNKLSYANKQKVLHYSKVTQTEHRKQAESANLENAYQGLIKENEGLPLEVQKTNMLAAASKFNDQPELQDKLTGRINNFISRQVEQGKAKDQSIINETLTNMEKNKTDSLETLASVEYIEGLSREGKELLSKKLGDGTYDKVTILNQNATINARRLIDSGKLSDQDKINAYALDNGLALSQVTDLTKYYTEGGKLGGLTQANIDKAMVMLKIDPNKYDKEDFYNVILSNPALLKDGVAPSIDDLKKLVGNLILDGETKDTSKTFWGYGKDETAFKAYKEGKGGKWLPDFTDEDQKLYLNAPEVKAAIAAGESQTMAIRKHRKRLMGLPEQNEE